MFHRFVDWLPYLNHEMQVSNVTRWHLDSLLPAFHDLNTEVSQQIYETYGLTEMEMTDDVFQGKHSVVFDQAENRLHSIKAIMSVTLGDIF